MLKRIMMRTMRGFPCVPPLPVSISAEWRGPRKEVQGNTNHRELRGEGPSPPPERWWAKADDNRL